MTSVHPLNDTRIFIKECKTLYRAGFDVTLIVQHTQDEVIEGIKILSIPYPRNRKQRIIRTPQLIYQRALKLDADIYHFHDPELCIVGLWLKKRGKKVIYDVHEDLPRQILTKDWIPTSTRAIISSAAETIEEYTARRLDGIICATPHITQRFQRLNHKVININNYPILQELFIPQTTWSDKESSVCFIGGIHKLRGIDQMIDAIEKTDATLLLAGLFDSASERDQSMHKAGWHKVQELGQVNREQVRTILGKSIAGLVLYHAAPNHINAQPNKMFEYMSAGVPVIASDFPLWKEIVEDNQCGICVNPLNVQAIADSIKWMVTHLSEAEQMGKNGRTAVEQLYNWENESEKLIQLYKTL